MTTMQKMLVGFTAGAILGILYAPKKGAKTRRKLACIGSNIKEGWQNITDKIADRIEQTRNDVENIADETYDEMLNKSITTSAKMGGNI